MMLVTAKTHVIALRFSASITTLLWGCFSFWT